MLSFRDNNYADRVRENRYGCFPASLEKGECLQDILEWSNEQLDELYDYLKELNALEQWDKAIDASTFLIAVNPFVGSFYIEA